MKFSDVFMGLSVAALAAVIAALVVLTFIGSLEAPPPMPFDIHLNYEPPHE